MKGKLISIRILITFLMVIFGAHAIMERVIAYTVNICNSYNTDMRDLPDIYAQTQESQAGGHRHMYQANAKCP